RTLDRHDHDDIGKEHQPHPVAQHPEWPEQKGPERKALAHEYEAVGVDGQVLRLRRRFMYGVYGHLGLTVSSQPPAAGKRITRPTFPWSRESRWRHAGRSQPPPATPAPDP